MQCWKVWSVVNRYEDKWLGRLKVFSSEICMFVCLFAGASKTNDPKVFKHGEEWPWDILELTWFRSWKSKVKITGSNSISAFFIIMTIMPTLMYIWLTTAIRCWLKLYECLLVIIIITLSSSKGKKNNNVTSVKCKLKI